MLRSPSGSGPAKSARLQAPPCLVEAGAAHGDEFHPRLGQHLHHLLGVWGGGCRQVDLSWGRGLLRWQRLERGPTASRKKLLLLLLLLAAAAAAGASR